MNNKKQNKNKPKCRKRKRQSVASSDTDDSDITFAESEGSNIEFQRDSEYYDRDLENVMCQPCLIEETVETSEKTLPTNGKQPLGDIGEYNESGKKSKEKRTVEKQNILEENVFPKRKIQILDSEDVHMILDDKTGKLKVSKQRRSDGPEVGKYVLGKFEGKNTKKTYRYVCMIQEIYGQKVVVQGLRSCKLKHNFKIIENAVSIIDESDILSYLPNPVRQNDIFVFPCAIDVKELI